MASRPWYAARHAPTPIPRWVATDSFHLVSLLLGTSYRMAKQWDRDCVLHLLQPTGDDS